MTYALDSRVRALAIAVGDDIQIIQADITGLLGTTSQLDGDLAAFDADLTAAEARITALEGILPYTKAEADAKFVDNSELDARIQSLVGASPATLDTLAEIAAALGNDPNLSATLTAQIATKLNASAVSSVALTLLDDTSISAMRTTLGLGSLATLSSVATANVSNDAINNTKLANMAAATIKGNNTAASADPVDLTVAQVKTMLNYVVADVGGLQTALDNKLDDTQATTFGLSLLGAQDAAAANVLLGSASTDTDYVALYNTARTTP